MTTLEARPRHPWLVVALALLAAGVVLWVLVLRPAQSAVGPRWAEAGWHLLDLSADERELLIGVGYTHCGPGPVRVPAHRVSVSEDAGSVLVRAELRTGGFWLPGIGRNCVETARTITATVRLEAPLGTRALHGCRQGGLPCRAQPVGAAPGPATWHRP